MAASICFKDNYITFDLKDEVKGVDLDGRYFANHTTTHRTLTFCSTEITVYYLLDHLRMFPVKVGVSFTPGETVIITKGALADMEVDAEDAENHRGVWGY